MRGVGEDGRGEGSVAAGETNKAKVMSTGVRNYLVCAGKGAGMEEACRLWKQMDRTLNSDLRKVLGEKAPFPWEPVQISTAAQP